MQIAIFDDQREDAQAAARAVAAYWTERGRPCHITVCLTQDAVRDWLRATPDASLIFLDIAVEGAAHAGIELARQVHALRPACQIVYLTSHIQYATEIFDTDPLYFVLKPELDSRLPAIYEKYVARRGGLNTLLRFQRKGGETLVHTADILYCEHRERKIDVVTVQQTLTVYRKMSEVQHMLEGWGFVRCHNSYIVNLRYVTDFCRSGFTLQNGAIIPISRSYYPRVKELFTVYVSQRR